MSEKPLTLTIVIPVYNEQRYLPACLDAIAKQSIMPDEVIVVDNNSTDNTVMIAQKYKFIKVIKEPKQGIVFARNTGFDSSRSDIIGRIDADTILASNWVASVKKIFKNNPNNAAVTGSCYFYDFPFRKGFHTLHSFVYYTLQDLIAGTHILWGSNMAIKKSNWHKIHPLCHNVNGIHEDIDLSLCLHAQRQHISHTSNMQAEVSLRRGNLSIRNLNRYLAAWHKTYFTNHIYFRTVFILMLETLTILSAIIFLPFRKFIKSE